MKLIKSLLIGVAALIGTMQAATITIAPGFGGGIKVTTVGVQSTYTMSVGSWNGTSFTQFGSTVANKAVGAGIGGEFAGTSPTSLNNAIIDILITSGTESAVLRTTSAFPADVTSALASTTANVFNSSNVTLVSGNATFANSTTLNFAAIPEPSVALLGALGLIGLVRRRR